MKWIAPALAYLAVGAGLFIFHSAWGALLGFHIVILVSLLIARPNIPVTVLFKSTNLKWIQNVPTVSSKNHVGPFQPSGRYLNINWILLSILLCGSGGVSLYFLWDKFRFANDLSAQVEALGLNSATWPAFIAYFALVNPFIEEYFWRGYLGSQIKSLHISDLLYAGFHALILMGKVHGYSIMFGLSVLVFAGWLWRQIAREDQGLLAPVLGHMAADFTILMTILIKV